MSHQNRSAMPFRRPGPELLNEVIPAFFIGRNRDGFWVARDAAGKSGGLFWRKEAALDFAKRGAGPVGCAAIFLRGRIELDIENSGNPLIDHIGIARRLLAYWGVHRFAVAMCQIIRS